MLRIEDRESGNFSVYKVKCVECKYLDDNVKDRVNITILTECGEVKLRAATQGNKTAKMAAEKISSSICQNISLLIFEGRGLLNIFDSPSPDSDDQSSFQVVGGQGHFDQ